MDAVGGRALCLNRGGAGRAAISSMISCCYNKTKSFTPFFYHQFTIDRVVMHFISLFYLTKN